MKIAIIIAQAVLFAWFFGCICTYKIRGRVLVDGMGIKSAEFFMLCLYALSVALFWIVPKIGKWALFAVLLFWITIQFFCHWYYTVFGVSEKKLTGYNQCFRNTIRIFPASGMRLVPDLYHIVLHALIIANICLTLIAA